jgi:hypothetical protein
LRDVGSYDGFQVRLHYVLHSNDPCSLPQFVHREKAFAEAVAKSFDRDVQAHLIAELEAVNDGLGRAIDAQCNASLGTLLDSMGKGLARESKNPKFEVRRPRLPGGWGKSHPYLMGTLRG